MGVKVSLPPGCHGLEMADGTRYDPGPRQEYVTVADRHAGDLRRSAHAANGVVVAGAQFSFGTKTGRVCRPCGRVWNAWNTVCVRCGAPTIVEEQ